MFGLEKLFGGGFNTPVKDLAEWKWMSQQAAFTPDLCMLERAECQLLFVGDDMKRNREQFHLLNGESELVCTAVTKDSFNFLIKASDRTPFALRPNQEEEFMSPSLQKFAPPRKILGELHKVNSVHFPVLDTHRQNGVQFRRERVKLIVPYRLERESECERTHEVTAHMYVAAPSYWAPLINGGTSIECVPIIKPKAKLSWLPEYYTYPRNGQLQDR